MNVEICRAIREKRLLQLEYKGHMRTIAPHVYGIDSAGDEMLSGYQVGGGSAGGESSGWKSLKVSEIRELSVTAKKFGPRREYRHNDPAMTEIFCQL